MALPASTVTIDAAIQRLAVASNLSIIAQQSLTLLTTTAVSSDWAFGFMDQLRAAIGQLNALAAIQGINAAATQQIPGYLGTLTADLAATVNAAQACVTWIVTNFPKDSTGTWLLSHQLNADGSRTPRTFISASTVGLQTAVQGLISTIS